MELISADNYEIILNPEDHYYFWVVVLNLICARPVLYSALFAVKFMMPVNSRNLPFDTEKVHLTLTKNRKEDTVYSVREEVHRCLEERDMNALKVTN